MVITGREQIRLFDQCGWHVSEIPLGGAAVDEGREVACTGFGAVLPFEASKGSYKIKGSA